MNPEQAVSLAEASPGLSAILIGGMHAVVATVAAEQADERGVVFSWIMRNGKTIATVPNYSAGKQ